MEQEGDKLIPKSDGKIGKKEVNNKGVYAGSPISDTLFVIYDDQMMTDYGNQLTPEIKEQRKINITRAEDDEYKWSKYKNRYANKETLQETIPALAMGYNENETNQIDPIIFSDESALKANGATEVYPRNAAFGSTSRKSKFAINWGKCRFLQMDITTKSAQLKK